MKKHLLLLLLFGMLATGLQAQSFNTRSLLIGVKAAGPLAFGSAEVEYKFYKGISVIGGVGLGYYGGLKLSGDLYLGAMSPIAIYTGVKAVHFASPWVDLVSSNYFYAPVGVRLFSSNLVQFSFEGAVMLNETGRYIYGGIGLHWAPGFNRD